MADSKSTPDDLGVPKALVTSLLTPTDAAIAEAGKALFRDSVKSGIDYCKFMVPICSGEVPAYLALLKFVGLRSNLSAPPSAIFVLSAVPAGLFVVATLVFVLGVTPRRFLRETLDTPVGADNLYRGALNRGRAATLWGTAVFLGANLLAIGVVSYALAF